jgi:hypothetical protein
METQQRGGVTKVSNSVKRTRMTINPADLEKAEPEDRVMISLLYQRFMFTLVDAVNTDEIGVRMYVSKDEPTQISYQFFIEIPATYKLDTEKLEALRQFAPHTMHASKIIEVVEKPETAQRLWWRISIIVDSLRCCAIPRVVRYAEIEFVVDADKQYNGPQGMQFKPHEQDSHGLVKRVRLDESVSNGSRKRHHDAS